MGKIRKTWYFVWSEWAIASNSLSVVGGDLLSIDGWFVVKSGAGDVVAWVATWEQIFAEDNQTVAKAVIDFPVKNEEMRVELDTVTDLAQANVWGKFDVNASQDVVLTAAWTQVQLVEILDTRKGSFKIL